jgi:hypothetical protein
MPANIRNGNKVINRTIPRANHVGQYLGAKNDFMGNGFRELFMSFESKIQCARE